MRRSAPLAIAAPKRPVVDAGRWPAPTLDEAARAGLEPLRDFALSRFALRAPELDALRRWPAEALLDALRRRASAGPDWVAGPRTWRVEARVLTTFRARPAERASEVRPGRGLAAWGSTLLITITNPMTSWPSR